MTIFSKMKLSLNLNIFLLILSILVNSLYLVNGNGDQESQENLIEIAVFPSNATVNVGDKVFLNCSILGNLTADIEIKWFKRNGDELLPPDDDHYEFLPDGSLVFYTTQKEDEGFYQCSIISLKSQKITKTHWAFLRILVPVNIYKNTANISISYGSTFDAECNAEGDPLPQVSWFLNEEEILSEGKHIVQNIVEEVSSEGSPIGFIPKTFSTIRIVNATQSARVLCEAKNDIVGGISFDKREISLQIENIPGLPKNDDEFQTDFQELPRGACASYNGKICKGLINRQFFINDTEGNAGGQINEQITTGLWHEMISGLKEPCKSAAEALLCAYAFPRCILRNWSPFGLTICYEDCIAVKYSFCYNEWALIEDNKQRGIYFKSRGYFRLPPDCSVFPRLNDSNSQCSNARLTDMDEDEITVDCIKNRGRFYQGTANVTRIGIPCQRWDSQVPHSHDRPPMVFPEIQNSENYCRNPAGTEKVPWCYTSDPNIRWQFCDIPKCESEVVTEDLDNLVVLNVKPPKDNYINYYWNYLNIERLLQTREYIIIAGSLVVIIFSLLIICVVACSSSSGAKKKKKGSSPIAYNRAELQEVEIDLDKLDTNSDYHQHTCLNPKLEKLEYRRNDIIYIRDLGEGCFGRVFQAKASGIKKGEEFTMVAVKMLKEEANEDLIADFEREACLLAEFDHPNIIKILGVCALGKPMCLILEYMGMGDLNEFLRSNSPQYRLGLLELVQISKQICSGMVYLSDRKFVHRDLAIRNFLVDEHLNVKISDFGLSQKIYLQDYYKGQDDDAIPIRWIPLECILYNKYTVESDVWSFGVCLWEIFSYALQPYYGMTNEEVITYIKEGNILRPPTGCPNRIYELMKMCFQKNPSQRPVFRTIYQTIEDIETDIEKANQIGLGTKSSLSSKSSSQHL